MWSVIRNISQNKMFPINEINEYPFNGPAPWSTVYHIIYHLFSFRRSVQDYKIHMDMEIVIFRNQEARSVQNVQQSHGPVQYLRFQYNTNYIV